MASLWHFLELTRSCADFQRNSLLSAGLCTFRVILIFSANWKSAQLSLLILTTPPWGAGRGGWGREVGVGGLLYPLHAHNISFFLDTMDGNRVQEIHIIQGILKYRFRTCYYFSFVMGICRERQRGQKVIDVQSRKLHLIFKYFYRT